MFQSTPAQLDSLGTSSAREMGVSIFEVEIEPDVDCRVLLILLGPLGAYGSMAGRSKVVSPGHPVEILPEWTDCWPAGILESST
jgi:hypothetical protein